MQATTSVQMDVTVMVHNYQYCDNGLLSSLSVMFVDIDECRLGKHQCAQSCQNTAGSYTCSCRSGFTLSANGRRCNGKCYVRTINDHHN